ncbi:PucR family transcriptional regulator [Candidatus Enterococcus murrayae]|uniref:PucR family transcriptional regulator ligand-binding domain-containing protein n=1 Tax=Candidatus Enterococcus murrayae TaxID=2815321 RepID=A0ABS3HGC1_9ENTE|nr:PucR family transcriptional regulator [Enterococcus sp. MJM16]MBO0452481.1 PucR family transcriptional regulator ligand-binding domain-containing protein [Enterococcus sp. MJM16]
MTSIKEILQTPRFSELSLLNKHADLERPLDTIEIFETPDISYYIQKNALLVTTAMAFGEDTDGLCDLVRSLANVPSAGLAIKLGRYLTEIDARVLAVADELNFPILQIPVSLQLGDISHKLLSFLWHDQTEQIFFALEIQQKFVNLMIRGASVDTLVKELSSMIKQSVLLIDPFGEIISTHMPYSNLAALKTQKTTFLNKVRECQKERRGEHLLVDSEQGKMLINIFPLSSDRYLPYMLVIFDPDELPYPFSQFAIQQSLTVLTLALYKEQTLLNEKRAERRSFLTYLLNRKTASQDTDWLEYKRHFPNLNSNYYRVVYIESFVPKERHFYAKELDALTYDYLYLRVEDKYKSIMLFPTEQLNQWVFIVQQKTEILPILEDIHKQLFELFGVYARFGIGDPVNNIDLLHFSYAESKQALEESEDKTAFVSYNKIQGIKRITENVSNEDMRYFCVSILKNLAYPETEQDVELRRTLMTYLDMQCEITKTAELLFIHRNTVKYRIKKCEELLNTSINEPEFSLQLRVALFLSETEVD